MTGRGAGGTSRALTGAVRITSEYEAAAAGALRPSGHGGGLSMGGLPVRGSTILYWRPDEGWQLACSSPRKPISFQVVGYRDQLAAEVFAGGLVRFSLGLALAGPTARESKSAGPDGSPAVRLRAGYIWTRQS